MFANGPPLQDIQTYFAEEAMSGADIADCFRTLGLAPGASWEDVRQAYLDLVRVWHPDRFQSDPRFRGKAEQRLRKINQAYFTLKKSNIFEIRPEPSLSQPLETVDPQPASWHSFTFSWRFPQWERVRIVLTIFVACLAPVLLAGLLLDYLRAALPDTALIQSRLPRPAILTPSRIISPFSDLSVATDTLAAWARGEGIDLWRTIPRIGEAPARIFKLSAPPVGADPSVMKGAYRHRRIPSVTAVRPMNGSDWSWTTLLSGSGELCIANDTALDAFATLVKTRATQPLRAIYVQTGDKACIQHVAPGTYDVVAELGTDWNPASLHFQKQRYPAERIGPFGFYEITSAESTSGCKFDVVLRAH